MKAGMPVVACDAEAGQDRPVDLNECRTAVLFCPSTGFTGWRWEIITIEAAFVVGDSEQSSIER
jgi:hypothetical protein